jgi:hypothetical protein
VVTEQLASLKAMDASTQWQGIKEEFVVGLLMTGRARPMMEPTPNIARRFAKLGNRPIFPSKRAMTARFLFQKTASQAGGQGQEHHTRNLDMGVQRAV